MCTFTVKETNFVGINPLVTKWAVISLNLRTIEKNETESLFYINSKRRMSISLDFFDVEVAVIMCYILTFYVYIILQIRVQK